VDMRIPGYLNCLSGCFFIMTKTLLLPVSNKSAVEMAGPQNPR
jgi:hypothetical protein